MQFTPRLFFENERPSRVLIVDDEAPIRLLMSHILRQAGYEVTVASDGIEAFQKLVQAERIDILVTDLSMPGMNGIELARRARNTRPALRVLFVSGSLDCFPDTKIPNLSALAKPFTATELLNAVRDCLAEALQV